MVCRICGAEYDGEICPQCQTQAGEPVNQPADEQQGPDFLQYDYFPNRTEIRKTEFTAPDAGPQEPETGYDGTPGVSIGAPEPVVQDMAEPSWSTASHSVPMCPKCGSITHGAFCGQCGYRLAQETGWQTTGAPRLQQPAAQPFRSAPAAPYQEAGTRKKDKTWLVALIVSLVVVLVGLPLVGLFTYFVMDQAADEYYNRYNNYYRGRSGITDEYDRRQDNPDGLDDDDLDEFFEKHGFERNNQENEAVIPEDEGEPLLPNGVSNAEYQRLKPGMTYAEISAVIGGDGEILTSAEQGSYTAVWPGEYKTDALVTIIFENHIAVEISQTGLY